jgi:nitroimidazol reductase NimA-like FMN-containing flavoprotein (pyridoxamine 5'-phosphate oxidase superfamily)
MRRTEKEIKNRSQIEDILKQARVCRLAMADDDFPYIVPLNFGYRDDVIYIHSAQQGRKIDLLKKNPNVCFEVDEPGRLKKARQACDWGVDFKSVIGTGRAVFVDDKADKIRALDIIMAQYSDRSFEYSEEMLAKTCIIKIMIKEMTGKQSPMV